MGAPMDSAVSQNGFIFFYQESSEPLLNIFCMQSAKLIGEKKFEKRKRG